MESYLCKNKANSVKVYGHIKQIHGEKKPEINNKQTIKVFASGE